MQNMLTCTVGPKAEIWVNKLIDIVIAWAGFHFNGIWLETTAVIPPVTADTTGHHSILNLWVCSVQPQWGMSAAA